MILDDLTEDQVKAAYEEVVYSQAGQIVVADLERNLDVFGADYVPDIALAETPHPYRAYEERGMMRALRRIRAMVRYAQGESTIDETQQEEGDGDSEA